MMNPLQQGLKRIKINQPVIGHPIVMMNPLQQGLKPCACNIYTDNVSIVMMNPLQQGLKHSACFSAWCSSSYRDDESITTRIETCPL